MWKSAEYGPAIAVRCPHCEAEPGYSCQAWPSGYALNKPHAERRRLAESFDPGDERPSQAEPMVAQPVPYDGDGLYDEAVEEYDEQAEREAAAVAWEGYRSYYGLDG